MLSRSSGRSYYFVTLGTLDDESRRRPELHIYFDSKRPWFEIMDDLPHLADGR
jgi:hypothetical protein